jgi:hypothetical protein
MKKFLFSVCTVLAIFGCGGDVNDNMPCLTCDGSEGYPSCDEMFEIYYECYMSIGNPEVCLRGACNDNNLERCITYFQECASQW